MVQTGVDRVNKWRVAILFVAVSTALQLAVIPYTSRMVSNPGGYGYLLRHYRFALMTVCLYSVWMTGVLWKSPAIRALLSYYGKQVKMWGTGCFYVRISDQEAEAYRIAPGKCVAKKLPRRAYKGCDRRKRA